MIEIANGEFLNGSVEDESNRFPKGTFDQLMKGFSKGQTSPKLSGSFSGSSIENILSNLYSIVAYQFILSNINYVWD